MADPNISGGSGKDAQSYGLVNGLWQKNPIMFGFSGQVKDEHTNTDTAADTVTLDGAVVPAGEIWRITYVVMLTISGSCTNLYIDQKSDTIGLIVYQKVPPTTSIWYPTITDIIMIKDEKLRLTGLSMTLHDHLQFQYVGYRIDIDQ